MSASTIVGTNQGLSVVPLIYVHIELANGGQSLRLPYSSISKNTSHFIAPEFLPAEFQFKDPRNLRKDRIKDFFDHVLTRQSLHGPKKAFRFKAVQGQTLVKYPPSFSDADAGADTDAEHSTRRKLKGRSKTQRAAKIGIAGILGRAPEQPTLAIIAEDDMINSIADAGADCSSRHNTINQGPPHYGPTSLNQSLPPYGMEPTSYMIDQAGKDKLITAGVLMPMPMPINGPADGMPKYMVDAITHQKLQHLNAGTQFPAQDGKARQLRTSADALALKEANSAPTLPTRSRKKRNRES
jgi:hypothetical protein